MQRSSSQLDGHIGPHWSPARACQGAAHPSRPLFGVSGGGSVAPRNCFLGREGAWTASPSLTGERVALSLGSRQPVARPLLVITDLTNIYLDPRVSRLPWFSTRTPTPISPPSHDSTTPRCGEPGQPLQLQQHRRPIECTKLPVVRLSCPELGWLTAPNSTLACRAILGLRCRHPHPPRPSSAV